MQLGVSHLGVATQKFFTERRSGVRQSRVVGQNANRVFWIVPAESLGGAYACRTAADNDQSR
jgi:hypothetical protein